MVNKILQTQNMIFRNFHGMFALVNALASVLYNNKNTDEDSNWFYDIVENTVYFDESIEYTKNVWEYYFKQPCDIKLIDIDKSLETTENFFYNLSWENWTSNFHNGLISKEKLIDIHNFIFKTAKNKIQLKEEILKKIEEIKIDLELIDNNFISVHYRDYDLGSFEHHGHIGSKPEIEYWFDKIDQYDDKNLPIFLSTDSSDIINKFKERYKNRLRCVENIDRYYMKSYKGYINTSDVPEQNPYLHGLNAIIDCYLLSYGKTIIRQCSGFSFFSILLNPYIETINIDK